MYVKSEHKMKSYQRSLDALLRDPENSHYSRLGAACKAADQPEADQPSLCHINDAQSPCRIIAWCRCSSASSCSLPQHSESTSMASSRVILLLSVLAVALLFCSETSEAKVCGSDADCLTNNAEGSCVSGTCKYMCHRNFKDCDGDMDNGCESELTTDEFNCGGCGRQCPAPYNAKASCVDARCTMSDSDDFFIPGRY